jgi:hypothetical protein
MSSIRQNFMLDYLGYWHLANNKKQNKRRIIIACGFRGVLPLEL